MTLKSSKTTLYDDNFHSPDDALEFFRKRDRVRAVDLKEASNARSLSWNCEGTMLAVGCENRYSYVGTLDPHYCRVRSIYVGYAEGPIESLQFAHQNPRLFTTCSTDKTVRIWDTAVSKTHKRINSKEHKYFVCWSPDDQYIVCVGKSGGNSTVSAIDVRSEEFQYFASFKEEVFEIVFHPNGRFLFLTAEGGKLIVAEFPSLQRYRTFQAHPPLSECLSICLSPDGERLAVGGSDACCSIWNVADMRCTTMIDRMDYPVETVSFSKCSNMLAIGSEDSGIDIGWVGNGGNEKITEVPVQTQVHSIAWNPKYYLLAYATAPGEQREREQDTVRLFGCPGDGRRT